MIKETITYVDYDGVERTEDHYFNLSKVDLTRMQHSVAGGLDAQLKKVIAANDQGAILQFFEDLIARAYGIKVDGKQFKKSPEISEAFMQTGAYEVFFEKVAFDDVAGAAFVNALIEPLKANDKKVAVK